MGPGHGGQGVQDTRVMPGGLANGGLDMGERTEGPDRRAIQSVRTWGRGTRIRGPIQWGWYRGARTGGQVKWGQVCRANTME